MNNVHIVQHLHSVWRLHPQKGWDCGNKACALQKDWNRIGSFLSVLPELAKNDPSSFFGKPEYVQAAYSWLQIFNFCFLTQVAAQNITRVKTQKHTTSTHTTHNTEPQSTQNWNYECTLYPARNTDKRTISSHARRQKKKIGRSPSPTPCTIQRGRYSISMTLCQGCCAVCLFFSHAGPPV